MKRGTVASDYYIGVTDNAWFAFLADHRMAEVNFWRRSDRSFRVLDPGGIFLFKLHAPHHYIVGGGRFAAAVRATPAQAWEWFGEGNGAATFAEFLAGIRQSAAAPPQPITCILLAECFYFPRSQWIPAPASFHGNIQSGKGYHIADEPRLWDEVQLRLAGNLPLSGANEASPAYAGQGAPRLVQPRLGQALFRRLVTDAYGRRCAASGERVLPVLEAAHVVPHARGGQPALDNGLLLRTDLHRLFDAGYMTVDPDRRRLVVSPRLKSEFHNGVEYLRLNGMPLAAPAPGFPGPSRENLAYHFRHIYSA